MIVAIDNVIQNPSSSFTVSGNAITFSSAPLSGTNNIWVEYTSLITTYQGISQDPTVIGDIRATGGYLAEGDFGNSFVDGAILDYVTGNGRITVGDADGLTIYNGGTTARTALVTVGATGNVGIGGSPVANNQLTLYNASYSQLRLQNGTSGAGSSDGFRVLMDGVNATITNHEAGYTAFETSDTERMRIDSNGYVAIGTASPSNEAMLHIKATSSAFPQLQLVQDNATDGWNLNATSSGGWLAFQRKGSGGTSTVAYYDPSGNLVISGSTAQKASGTTWSNPSDVRLKDNVTEYTKGLTELLQVNVKSWEYNGKAGTTEGSKGLGVIADEIMQVLPDTVDTYEAKLNAEDEVLTDVKRFDATEITWLLVNAVKELKAEIDALKASK
jgi:hypothetical protein